MINENYMATLSKDQMLVMSLIPHNGKTHDIKLNEINFLNNSEILYNNREEYFQNVESVYMDKLRECKLCNTKYDKLNHLKKHVIVDCFYNYIKNKKVDNEKNKIEIDITNNSNTGKKNKKSRFFKT